MDYVIMGGAFAIACAGWSYCWLELRDMRSLKSSFARDYRLSLDTLNALRRNCFITNEKGHRVRYRDASPERQALAEK